jgi:hypothetical protein
MRDPKRLWRIKPMLCRSRLPSAKSTAKVPRFSMRGVRLPRQIQETAQDYSGFGLKPQTPTPKTAQLTSLAPARGNGLTEVIERRRHAYGNGCQRRHRRTTLRRKPCFTRPTKNLMKCETAHTRAARRKLTMQWWLDSLRMFAIKPKNVCDKTEKSLFQSHQRHLVERCCSAGNEIRWNFAFNRLRSQRAWPSHH